MSKIGIIFMVCIVPFCLFAQTASKNVSANITMKIESHMSEDDAKREAVRQAIIQALGDEFGTKVSQSTRTKIESLNAQTTTRFSSIGGTFVNGTWIDHRDDPVYEFHEDENGRYISCSVKGTAKHSPKPEVDLTTYPINCLNKNCQTQEYQEGEQLMVYFKSPVDGFLSIYFDDEQFCQMLLPYQRMKSSTLQVEADKEYYLFSTKYDYTGNVSEVDEYPLYANYDNEVNLLYVVFSTYDFAKPKMSTVESKAGESGLVGSFQDFPKESDSRSFRKWLNQNLTVNDDLQMRVIDVTITK